MQKLKWKHSLNSFSPILQSGNFLDWKNYVHTIRDRY